MLVLRLLLLAAYDWEAKRRPLLRGCQVSTVQLSLFFFGAEKVERSGLGDLQRDDWVDCQARRDASCCRFIQRHPHVTFFAWFAVLGS